MNNIFAVTAAKGGVGKTFVSTYVALGLCKAGKKVLIIDCNYGYKTLDCLYETEISSGHDLGDEILEKCERFESVTVTRRNPLLSVISAPSKQLYPVSKKKCTRFLDELSQKFDYLLLDIPACDADRMSLVSGGCKNLLVLTTADVFTAKFARIAVVRAEKMGIKTVGLVINRVPTYLSKLPAAEDLDQIMDIVSVPLMGVIPESVNVERIFLSDRQIPHGDPAVRACHNIAGRILGNEIPVEFG